MTPEQWQRWIFWFIAYTGGSAFVACFVLMQIQPRKTLRLCGLCFGWVLACVGTLFLLGAWQTAVKEGGWQGRDWRIAPGIGLWALGLVIGRAFWFGDKRATPADDAALADEGFCVCTRHARWINWLGFLGFLLGAAATAGILKWRGPGAMTPWIIIPVFLGFQIPSIALTFVFGPRCPSCRTSRMKLVSYRPACYECPACGCIRETQID